MSGIRLLNGIHGECADSINAKLVHRICHRFILTSVRAGLVPDLPVRQQGRPYEEMDRPRPLANLLHIPQTLFFVSTALFLEF